jgi:hypothetical protein
MAIQLVNVGTLPNDGEGDPLRVAFQKINNNFVQMQSVGTNIAQSVTLDDAPNQVILEYPADKFTQALIQVQSYREDNNDSQNAFLGAQIYNDGSDIKFTIYGVTNVANWLTNYDMDVTDGKVRLLVSPLQNEVIQHFIAYQVTWTGDLGLGSTMITDSGANITLEMSGNVSLITES